MAIKLPKEMIESGYNFDIAMPKPIIETEKKADGSFSLYAKYDASAMDHYIKEIAREMNEKIESGVLAELMKLNGYAKERTCVMSITRQGPRYITYHFSCCDEFYIESMTDSKANSLPATVCPFCGARVIE